MSWIRLCSVSKIYFSRFLFSLHLEYGIQFVRLYGFMEIDEITCHYIDNEENLKLRKKPSFNFLG